MAGNELEYQEIALQDQKIRQISDALVGVKGIATEMNDELSRQNEMLEDTCILVDNTKDRINHNSKFIDRVIAISSNKGYMCMIVMLLILIVLMVITFSRI